VRRLRLGPGPQVACARLDVHAAKGAVAVVMPTGEGDKANVAAAWAAGVPLRS
jgi:hypothetical protein